MFALHNTESMKKILMALIVLTYAGKGIAQSDGDPNVDKKFRFGLHLDPTFSWYAPVDKKKFENAGTRLKFSVGALTDFKLAENIWLSTGLSMSFYGGKLNYLEGLEDTVGYFIKDDEITPYDQIQGLDTNFYNTHDFIRLDTRTFNVNYLTIPLLLKMKTKEISYLTYCGQFGLLSHLKLGAAKANDLGDNLSTAASNDFNVEDLLVIKEPNFLQLQVNVGFGVEYNISGSTSLFGSVGFNYGINSAVKGKSDHLVYRSDNSGTFTRYEETKAPMHSVVVSLGVLF
jgi:hypothetical protein